MKNISIDGRNIGSDHPPYVVAEISANHNGDIDKAKSIILAAKESGADAIKLQSYTPDTLTINCDKNDFLIKEGPWSGYKLYDLYKEAYTPFEWHKPLFDYCKDVGITCFSSPFDKTAVDLLEELNCPAYKIASFEVIDLPLIKYVAQTGKPMVISTGMASQIEIEEALQVAKKYGCGEIILLHCISSYPAPINQSNLRTIPDMVKRFNVMPGLSDHTLGTTAAVAAVSLGACFIEKHFTLNRKDKGPDSSFSLEPNEFSNLCTMTADAWSALGIAGYEKKPAELENIIFRRSLYFVKDIKLGEVVTNEHVKSIRPGYGLPPKHINKVIGKKVMANISRGEPVEWNQFTGCDDE